MSKGFLVVLNINIIEVINNFV